MQQDAIPYLQAGIAAGFHLCRTVPYDTDRAEDAVCDDLQVCSRLAIHQKVVLDDVTIIAITSDGTDVVLFLADLQLINMLDYKILILAGDIIAPGYLRCSHRICRVKVICRIQIIRGVQTLDHLFQHHILQFSISTDVPKTSVNLADGFNNRFPRELSRIDSFFYHHIIVDQCDFFLFHTDISTKAISELSKRHWKCQAVIPPSYLCIQEVVHGIIGHNIPISSICRRYIRIHFINSHHKRSLIDSFQCY